MEFRRYGDEYYNAVCDFLIELNKGDDKHINWNWARFEWMAEHPEFDKSLRDSIGLWFEGGRIIGTAIYDMYFGEAFCGALPEHASLYREILSYAYENLRDENGLGIAICDGCDKELEAARAMGFSPAEQEETVMRLELDKLPSPVLPLGLAFRELDQVEDIDSVEWAIWQGFDHGSDREEFEREGRSSSKPRVHFDKRLSIGAVTEAGEVAALCCLWLMPHTDYAYVEPVCTVPSRRGMGVGSAVVKEALRRASELGAKRAYVISDSRFYESLGFKKARHYTFYWKK